MKPAVMVAYLRRQKSLVGVSRAQKGYWADSATGRATQVAAV